MKYLFQLIVLVLLLVSCSKEKVTSTVTAMDVPDTTAQLKYSARFANGPYGTTSGTVKIYVKATVYTMVLDSFMVNSGPDLHVYLSKEVQPLNFLDLGVLRSNSGVQVYNINGMPDFKDFKYALIHCQQFNHLFGSAILK